MGKHSYADDNSAQGIDIISQLPDELLIRNLSLLPAADVTRSRILSNRWKHLGAFLPNLHFVMPKFKEHANKFYDTVHQVLALRGGMPIHKFFLQYSYGCNDDRVNNWLHIVTQCKVDELEFRLNDTYIVRFNLDLFRTCSNTLFKFTFKGPGAIVIPELEITFKCLKKFNLQDIKLFDENSLTNLISWCPVLEELCLDRPQLTRKSHIVKLSSSSIRRLTIKRSLFEDRELVIDVPKLECLQLLSCYVREYTLMSPTSLVETHITNTSDVIKLLIFATSTKILRLISEYLLGIVGIWNINLPMYPYLVKLEIACDCSLLLALLNNMPNLEYLYFPYGLLSLRMEWNPPKEEAPDCLRFKLKEIFIVSYASRKEFAILCYLLEHANVLEKLKISKVDPERREPWLNIHHVGFIF